MTQALCAVCAVSYDDVRAIAGRPPEPPGGDLARPRDARRGPRRPAHDSPRPPGEPERGERLLDERSSAGSARSPTAVAGRAAPAGRGARVARPGLRRRPLGPGDGRARRRRGRARRAAGASRGWSSWDEVAAARPGGRRRDALRPLRRRGRGAGPRPRRAAARRSAPDGWSPSTPPRRSRARARGWSTGSSCSPTSFTRSWSRRPPGSPSRTVTRPAGVAPARAALSVQRPGRVRVGGDQRPGDRDHARCRPGAAISIAFAFGDPLGARAASTSSAASPPPISPPMWRADADVAGR